MPKLPDKNQRRIDHLLKMQLKAFRRKFGRDPEPGEPVFFDPDADSPELIPKDEIEAGLAEFAKLLPPEFAYAFTKTGLAPYGKQ